MSQVQLVELSLSRTVVVQRLVVVCGLLCPVYKQVVERTVADKLQSAERVGDTFPVVTLTVCIVVHRVGVPLVACAPVGHVQNPVHDWVAEVHVRIGHVYLCP